MTIETERLFLRPWSEDDAADLYELACDERVGPAAGWHPHKSVEESREVIRTILSEKGTFAVTLKGEGKAIGSISLMTGLHCDGGESEGSAELGYWIGVPYWGNGYIPEAARALIDYAFTDGNITTLWCAYFDGNDKSRRVQEKCGFIYHHTEKDKLWTPTGEIKTENFTRLTKREWLDAREATK